LPSRWKGVCQTGAEFNARSCNRKIIGARWYTGGIDAEVLKNEYMSPRDKNGHGTHVASTIAGSEVRNVSFGGLAAGVEHRAPRMAIYKACWDDMNGGGATCSTASILTAIDDAINDGVDVLSLRFIDEEIPGTLHAVARGITVVFAAGKEGPDAKTVSNVSPWVLTVAASTIDRSFPTMMTLGNNEKVVVSTY
jgi:subtilisin family serine protease